MSPPLRRQQAEALDALAAAFDRGAHAGWIVLPPGGGKTRVGLEAIRASGHPAVVLCPNTAIQGQWITQAADLGMAAGDTRDLTQPISVLTYQALAVFRDDVDDEPADLPIDLPADLPSELHLDRLHPNAKALVERMAATGPMTLVLDECHHLLAIWGELLTEVLDRLPEARVVALTATPPASLSPDEALLVERLFGAVAYTASIPGFVRDGHLAPFREMVAFTEPTAVEADYLAGTASRFAELRDHLMRPGETSVDLLTWLDRRFVERATSTGATAVTWEQVARRDPMLADAVVRAHVAGLVELPPGAGVGERHRRPLDADDWGALLGDYVTGALRESTDPRDTEVVERLRKTLPGIGFRLTRRGLSRGTTPVDRVVARSASKATAAVDITVRETIERGDALRLLVLTDFERAGARTPEGLAEVIEPEEGSARGVLRRLLAGPATSALQPVLVTGRTVACGAEAVDDLLAWLIDAGAPEGISPVPADGLVDLAGPWDSRRWVPLLTRWFEEGRGRVLIGTRALLGEGWDARGVNVLIDLTTATTPMAVTQARGRALRTDPRDPAKVAHTWTVVCVADEHPLGMRDYERFVRKHRGFFAVTDDGLITDGVTHVHPALSPVLPPDAAQRSAITAQMHARAGDRDRTRELWRIGEPYDDVPVADVRIRAGRSMGRDLAAWGGAASVVLGPDRAVRARGGWLRAWREWLTGRSLPDDGHRVLSSFAAAVADALQADGKAPGGASDVRVEPGPDGAYRVILDVPDEAAARAFAESLDEAVSPLADPRYLLPRVVLPVPVTRRDVRRLAWRRLWRRRLDAAVVWHAVPGRWAARREHADRFAQAWNRWISPGGAVFVGTPEGAGILAAQGGDDPFAVETAMRVEWR